MHFDWILFDADHTLFDFDRSSREALTHTLMLHQVHPADDHWTVYDRINKECWAAFEKGELDRETMRTIRFSRFFRDINAMHVHIETFASDYLHTLPTRPYFIQGAPELLHALHGRIRIGIITNGLKEVQRPRLESTGIDKLCEVIVVSGEIDLTKPHHDFFDYAHRHMGRPDKQRVLVVGDSLTADIHGGSAYGFRTCWFNPNGAPNDLSTRPDYEISYLYQIQALVGLS